MVASAREYFDEASDKPIAQAHGINKLNLIGFACGLGASNLYCAYGPEVLKQLGLLQVLDDQGVDATWKCLLKILTQALDHKQITAKLAIEALTAALVRSSK